MFYSYGYLFYIPINILYTSAVWLYGIKKQKESGYYIMATLFAIYVNMSINLVYFPLITDRELWGELLNYIDFSLDFAEMGGRYQIFGNILLTIPIGLFFPFLLEVKKKKLRIIILIGSCSFEVIQLLIICLAKSVTVYFDIKDLILNICGGFLGIVLFEMFAKLFRIFVKKKGNNVLLNYILDVCYENSGKIEELCSENIL